MRKRVLVNGLKSGEIFNVVVDLVKPYDKRITIVNLNGYELGRIEKDVDCWWYRLAGEGFFSDLSSRKDCVSAIVRGTYNDYPERVVLS